MGVTEPFPHREQRLHSVHGPHALRVQLALTVHVHDVEANGGERRAACGGGWGGQTRRLRAFKSTKRASKSSHPSYDIQGDAVSMVIGHVMIKRDTNIANIVDLYQSNLNIRKQSTNFAIKIG